MKTESKEFCFYSVYDCLSLFILATNRYAHLPAYVQNAFGRLILEPLLAICMGLLLYRIRTCLVLKDIGRGMLPPDNISPKTRPDEMIAVIKSATYVKNSLLAMDGNTVKVKKDRFEIRWKLVRAWVTDAATSSGKSETSGLSRVIEYITEVPQVEQEDRPLISFMTLEENDTLQAPLTFAVSVADALCEGLERQYDECLF